MPTLPIRTATLSGASPAPPLASDRASRLLSACRRLPGHGRTGANTDGQIDGDSSRDAHGRRRRGRGTPAGFEVTESIDADAPPGRRRRSTTAAPTRRPSRASARPAPPLPRAKLVLLTGSTDVAVAGGRLARRRSTQRSPSSCPPPPLWTLVRHVVAENVFHAFARAAEPARCATQGRGPDRPRARDPAARRLRPVERPHRRAALGHRADGEVPPLQHVPQARRHQPHAGEPLRVRAAARRARRLAVAPPRAGVARSPCAPCS